MEEMTNAQYQLVYNILSFALACMMASTIFFWLRLASIHEKYKSAVCITGLVTFIASYHYLRIFNSWTEAYDYAATAEDPTLTGEPFNDAYRYMDWLLTVPLLLIEIILVMNLDEEETFAKSWQLGLAAALMIILGYPGESLLEDDELSTRWIYWTLAMIPFAYVVYTLIFGLQETTNSEGDPRVRASIKMAQWATVISWCTYPVVYILPMFGLKGASAVVGIQVGYCVSDVISKCGVGLVIYSISSMKSKSMQM